MARSGRLRAVFLFGPTAVGKTELVGRLSANHHEIISADSLQVYRGLDIGTAKPDAELRSRLPHHLIDILDPNQQFDVGDFVERADVAIRKISERDRLPVVSGGAGFYLRHLLFGLPGAPAASSQVRKRVQDELATHGLAALFKRLCDVDPQTAQRVGPNDAYRITRALEVFEHSGRPLSTFPRPSEPRGDLAVLLIGLARPRPEVHARINRRVDLMFDGGLRDEVERLVRAGHTATAPAMRGIGYREFFEESGGLLPESDDKAIAARIKTNTRRYAKRQTTFFKALPGVRWIDADDTALLLDTIAGFRESR